jgi:hypothetical protein
MQELISSMKQEISFFESSIDPITRLSTDMNITLSGYIAAPSKTRDLPASDGTLKVSVNLHVLLLFYLVELLLRYAIFRWIAIEAGCYLATRVLSSDLEEGRSHCDIDVETQVLARDVSVV